VCAVAARTEHKHCLIRLKRIGDAEGRTVETQLRTEIPAIGDVIEVSADGTNVPARVIKVGPPDAEGHCNIEADELSSSYVLDTFSTLAQLDSGEAQFDTRSSVPAKSPHLAFGATLSLARQCHGLARHFLDRTKPDMQAALRYMRIARRAGWLAFPFIEDEELRRRIVGYKPMSEEEWKQLWPSDLPNQE
jgi:hypothetical protein